ncbi:hypothetical protein H2203_000045 [Taxawa tesnikishii (nom. ined.)]|nr:hypothetical protein H2203_000045 [Dothideales sp. JES 119]
MTAAEIGLSSKPAVKLPPTAKTADDDVAVHQGMEKRCNLEKDTGTASWRCSQAKNVSTSQPTEQRRVAREYHHRIAVPRIACRSKSPDYSKSARTPQAIQPPPAESAFHCPRPPSVDPDGTGVEMSLIGSLFDLTQAVQALQDIRDTDQDSHTPSAARLVHDTQRSLTGEESDHTSSDAVSSDTLAISPLYSLADFLALAQPAKEDAKPTMCTSPVDVISVSIHDSCSAPPSLILDTECDIDDIEWGIDICPEAAQPDGEVQTSEVEDWIMLSPDELTDPSTRDEEAIKKAGRQETLVCTTFATAPLTSTARNPIESIKGTGNAASSASKKQALPNKFHSLFHADAIETTPDVGNSRTSTFNLVCGPRDRS